MFYKGYKIIQEDFTETRHMAGKVYYNDSWVLGVVKHLEPRDRRRTLLHTISFA